MAEEKYVLFKRNSQDQDSIEDVWDDTALIQAYDRAVNLAKEKAAAKLAAESNASAPPEGDFSATTSSESSWKVGDYVTAVYSEDGIVYEAVIESIKNSTSSCIVKYIGYNNKEEVMLKYLRPSNGPESRNNQIEASTEVSSDEMECEAPKQCPAQAQKAEESKTSEWEPVQSTHSMPKKPPGFIPPPPPLTAWPTSSGSEENSDSLYSMLMSWYMAGYHTGYHQGVTQNSKRKSS